ncbi:hypothetical protein [Bacillus sp. NEB1478]|uniref:RelA/SpoT domain-containing protein n=1 Tax=Bacillus sp. NEB1478 TaxID=3073816 RepID=UPI002873B254|nr:hypothetical protein [Bacillus sp. NEB1478]WNB91843.1 hypothetical protein RGB74_18545 [Bacillus sp. NEB1478]
MLTKEQFFEKYNVEHSRFEEASLDWGCLIDIYNDYILFKETLAPSADTIANVLRKHPDVHSVRTRIKNPEHLLDKIIRKTIRKKSDLPEYIINKDNYKSEITDLIGIRVLHLYKDQAVNIDQYLRGLWELLEPCTIYYREGDFSSGEVLETNPDFNFQVHPAGYRSWHYLISTKITRQEHIAEIQIRTIFEEGWSEIDHLLRYPNNIDNILLKEQLLVLNRIAGSADEMANTIRETKVNIEKLISKNKESDQLIEELKVQLEEVLKENKVQEADRKKLEDKVEELERSRISSEGILRNYTFDNSFINNYQYGGEIKPITLNDSYSKAASDLLKYNLRTTNYENCLSSDGVFTTKKYLEGYTHPSIKKEDN